MDYNKRVVFVLHSVFITWNCDFIHVFKLLTSICHNQILILIILHMYDICTPKHLFIYFFLMHAIFGVKIALWIGCNIIYWKLMTQIIFFLFNGKAMVSDTKAGFVLRWKGKKCTFAFFLWILCTVHGTYKYGF